MGGDVAELELFEHHLGAVRERSRLTAALELWRFEPTPGRSVLVAVGRETRSPVALAAIDVDMGRDPLAALQNGFISAFEAAEGASWVDRPPAGMLFDGFHLLPPTVLHEIARRELPAMPWLVFGYQEEAEYVEEHGPAALMHLFEAQRLDPLSSEREAANTFVSPEDAARMAGASAGADRGNYKVQQQRGEVRIERRRAGIGRAPTRTTVAAVPSAPPPEPVTSPPPRPAPPRRAASTSGPKVGGRGSGRRRFDLDEAPREAAPAPTPVRRPAKRPPPDPVKAKAERVAALKAAAAEARERAKNRKASERPAASEKPSIPRPDLSRAVRAASRRRGRRTPTPGSS